MAHARNSGQLWTRATIASAIWLSMTVADGLLPFGRVVTAEELWPVNHLLPGQLSDVPSHVQRPMQDALQALPLCDYSPLDHHSGAFDKLAVRLWLASVNIPFITSLQFKAVLMLYA